MTPEEAPAFQQVVFEALHADRAYWDGWLARLGPANLRVARLNGEVVAGAGLLPLGQFFGGRSVACSAVSAVGVSAEHRGRGAGRAIMAAVLEETAARGMPLSTLYPSNQRFYRSLGYERAGWRLTYDAPTDAFEAPRPDGGSWRRVGDDATETVDRVHVARAARTAGHLDRGEFGWSRLFHPAQRPSRAYVFDGLDGTPEGYVFLVPAGQVEPMTVSSYAALTPRALHALANLLRSHAPLAPTIVWHGGVDDDQLVGLLPEQTATLRHRFEWMVRIVDVAGALEARGYPAGVGPIEVHLEVTDDLLPDRCAGRFVLRVADGHGEVVRGGRGDVALDVRTLAQLYTGHQHPRSAGLAAPAEAVEALGAAFGGPRPWMPLVF